MNKVTIKVKSEVEVDKEIELPYYFSYFGQHFLAITENIVICCFDTNNYRDISVGTIKTFKNQFEGGKPCSKEDFDNIYTSAKSVIDATNPL